MNRLVLESQCSDDDNDGRHLNSVGFRGCDDNTESSEFV